MLEQVYAESAHKKVITNDDPLSKLMDINFTGV